MNEKGITDPLISSTAELYSLAGLRRLLGAINGICVDDPAYICRGATQRRFDNEQRNGKFSRKK